MVRGNQRGDFACVLVSFRLTVNLQIMVKFEVKFRATRKLP